MVEFKNNITKPFHKTKITNVINYTEADTNDKFDKAVTPPIAGDKLNHISNNFRPTESVKIFSLSMKSINPVQKYPHIIEFNVCILNLFAIIYQLPMSLLISF